MNAYKERGRGRAHPRPCGEHDFGAVAKNYTRGSSPPVRGAPPGVRAYLAQVGLIPARAGSTSINLLYPLYFRAHPRPCGEHRTTI